MTACLHHINDDPNGLRCLLDDHPEHPNGHQYNASDAPDVRHQENASDGEWRR